jgi:spore germination cell wall hydrolase CwlJ-like protein
MSKVAQNILVKLLQTSLLVFCATLSVVVMKTLVEAKFATIRLANTGYDVTQISAEDRIKQLNCLARNIYYEAGNEPFEGKVAVAQVTMNRMASKDYPNTVCGVVYEKSRIMNKIVCQFSWNCIPSKSIKPIHPEVYKESEIVAKKVLLENFRLPSLHDAMFYHADYIHPGWKRPKITKIGHHIFYKAS